MSGRGNNKKHDSAQIESRNQNKQAVKGDAKTSKSNPEKKGGKTSAPRNEER